MIPEPRVRAAAHDLLMRYCRAVDRCDWDLLRSIYHDDAVLDHGFYQGDVDGFVDFVRGRRVGIVHSAHFVSNLLVEQVDENRVATEAYGWAVQTFKHPSALVRSGFQGIRQKSTYRYVDLLENRGGRWAMIECHLVLGELEIEHLAEEPGHRAGLSQQPDTSDPLYRLHRDWFGA